MNIGFDGKRAFHNTTGLGNYSRTLIQGLAQYYPAHQYFLFNPKRSAQFHKPPFDCVNEVLPSNPLARTFSSAWRSSWVKQDLKRLNIKLYHGLSHEIPRGIQNTSVASVVTIHDLIFERYPEQFSRIDRAIYHQKFTNACRHSNRVIAISNQTKQDIIELYKTPEEKIDVCYQSCHPAFAEQVSKEEKEQVKKLYNLPEHFLLYVGSIIERKNLLTICKALKLLQNKFDLPLVVIGNGNDYKKQVLQYIEENSMQQQVRFLSDDAAFKTAPASLHSAHFPAIYQLALCMIYPSFFEGFGIPVLEALWSRLPVITSNVSCLPETGGEAAYYIDPINAEEMAHAIMQVCSNSTLRNNMVDKGLMHAKKFTPEICTHAVMDVYKSLF